jgi:hypothetical protein
VLKPLAVPKVPLAEPPPRTAILRRYSSHTMSPPEPIMLEDVEVEVMATEPLPRSR